MTTKEEDTEEAFLESQLQTFIVDNLFPLH
jgi:hypothetical protein